jgi:hypothetical protein
VITHRAFKRAFGFSLDRANFLLPPRLCYLGGPVTDLQQRAADVLAEYRAAMIAHTGIGPVHWTSMLGQSGPEGGP